MGNTYIRGFMDKLPLDEVLLIHLQHNHYPPVHKAFIPIAKEAIECCKYGGEENYDHVIKMPNGKSMKAYQIVEGLHLHEFCAREADDE